MRSLGGGDGGGGGAGLRRGARRLQLCERGLLAIVRHCDTGQARALGCGGRVLQRARVVKITSPRNHKYCQRSFFIRTRIECRVSVPLSPFLRDTSPPTAQTLTTLTHFAHGVSRPSPRGPSAVVTL